MRGACSAACLLIALLLVVQCVAAATCRGGLSCENGQCVADASGAPFCSCFSGYSGRSCSTLVSQGQCPMGDWESLENLQTTSVPEIYLPGRGGATAVVDGELRLDIRSPLTVNRTVSQLTIQNSARPQCNFPSSFWSKRVDGEGCLDQWLAAIPFDRALECNWQEKLSRDYRVLRGDILVTHTDALDTFRGEPITRTSTFALPMQMSFPLSVSVSTDVSVTSEFELLAAITLQEFVQSNRTGLLGLTTSLQSPYRLQLVSVASRVRGVGAVAWPAAEVCPAASGAACLQETLIALDPAAGVCAFTGRYEVLFSVGCRPNVTCPLGSPGRALVTLDVTSEDFCTAVGLDIGLGAELSSFEDAALQTPRSAYVAGAQAYFQARLFSDAGVAALERSFVDRVVVTYGPIGRLVLWDGGAITDEGRSVGFAVLAEGRADVAFSFALNSRFPLYNGDGSVFGVVADLRVDYVPPARGLAPARAASGLLRAHMRAAAPEPGSQEIQEATDVVIAGRDADSDAGGDGVGTLEVAGISAGGAVAAALAVAAAACAAVVVAAAIFAGVAGCVALLVVVGAIPAGIRYRRKNSGSGSSDEESY